MSARDACADEASRKEYAVTTEYFDVNPTGWGTLDPIRIKQVGSSEQCAKAGCAVRAPWWRLGLGGYDVQVYVCSAHLGWAVALDMIRESTAKAMGWERKHTIGSSWVEPNMPAIMRTDYARTLDVSAQFPQARPCADGEGYRSRKERSMTLDMSARYRVNGYPGIAFAVRGYAQQWEPFTCLTLDPESGEECEAQTADGEWYDDVTQVIVTAIGDDRKVTVPIDDLTPLSDDAYCHECGQLDCTADGRNE